MQSVQKLIANSFWSRLSCYFVYIIILRLMYVIESVVIFILGKITEHLNESLFPTPDLCQCYYVQSLYYSICILTEN